MHFDSKEKNNKESDKKTKTLDSPEMIRKKYIDRCIEQTYNLIKSRNEGINTLKSKCDDEAPLLSKIFIDKVCLTIAKLITPGYSSTLVKECEQQVNYLNFTDLKKDQMNLKSLQSMNLILVY